jgi:hypothetical protein
MTSTSPFTVNAKLTYCPQASDTSIEADVYLFQRLRQLSLKQCQKIM